MDALLSGLFVWWGIMTLAFFVALAGFLTASRVKAFARPPRQRVAATNRMPPEAG